MDIQHTPVLLDQVVQILAPQKGESYLDATAGYGGHAAAILERIGPEGRIILVDRDANAVRALATKFGERAEIMHDSFLGASERLREDGTIVDMILLDLGVSSPQLDQTDRGFSFRGEAPLDMRMDQNQPHTAGDVVNSYRQAEIERILRDFGEEHRAKAVARAIVEARPIHTTTQLAKIVSRVVGSAEHGEIHPATRTFQALRIETNDELGQLEQALPVLASILAPGGRLAVISFHSLEDRIVKQFIARESKDCICPPKQPICTCDHVATLVPLLRKPIDGLTHDASNPRARSAKLRAAEKINQNKRRV
jgi:16S rRNA (cytosine1402-N4)-methyltransferase